MNLNLSSFVSDHRRRILQIALGLLLVWSIVWVVPELRCNWNGWSCDAHRAAERHVDALANNDYESYAADVANASVEDFEFQLACLDWSQVKVGEVRDSLVASDLKKVVLNTPSGDFFLSTGIRPPEGRAIEGKGFMVGVTSDTCPLDLDVLLQRERWSD